MPHVYTYVIIWEDIFVFKRKIVDEYYQKWRVMLRLILVVLFVVLFLIITLPVLFVEWIIGHFNLSAKHKSSLAMVKWAFRCCLFFADTKITVLGKENVPTDKAVLYVANHRSYFDIIINYTLVPSLTGFVSKIEMIHWPILRTWMKNVNCLFLDRNDIRQGMQTILSGVEKIKSGISMFIFPEGTRNKVDDTFLPFKGGSFKMAEKAGCAIIPIAINNSGQVFEDHLPKIKKAHVVLEFGKPIETASLSKEDKKVLHDTVRDQIIEMYEKNKALV